MPNIKKYQAKWMDFQQFQKEFQKAPVEEYPNQVLEKLPKPVATFLIITYQHKNYIRDAIESVLMQETQFPFEVIIGDDESTDGTREICIEYARRHPDIIRLFLHKRENNIRVLGKPCGIFQIAYNLYKSRGQFIAVCSGDDYWTDALKIQKQYDFMKGHPEYAYCYHGWRFKQESASADEQCLTAVKNQDRIQTLFFRNVFTRLPKEFMNVIQEDVFIKYILSINGKSWFLSNISPAVCRIHDNNIWGVSGAKKQYDEQLESRLHTWNKIRNTFRNTKFEREINRQISFLMVSGILFHPELHSVRKIYSLLSSSYSYKAALYLPHYVLNKLQRKYDIRRAKCG